MMTRGEVKRGKPKRRTTSHFTLLLSSLSLLSPTFNLRSLIDTSDKTFASSTTSIQDLHYHLFPSSLNFRCFQANNYRQTYNTQNFSFSFSCVLTLSQVEVQVLFSSSASISVSRESNKNGPEHIANSFPTIDCYKCH